MLFFYTCLLIAGALVSVKFNKHNLIPNAIDNLDYSISTSHESVDKGFSKSQFQIEDNQIHFSYQLSKSQTEPFSSIYLQKLDRNEPFFSIEEFNSLDINITSESGTRIPINILINYEGFSSDSVPLSDLTFKYILDYDGPKVYRIPLSKFITPSWWYRHHGVKASQFRNPDFSRVTHVVIGSCELLQPGERDEIVVKSIDLSSDNRLVFKFFMVIGLVGYIVIGVLYKFKKRKKILVPFVANDVVEEPRNKLEEVVLYMAKNYNNSNLAQLDFQRELGITAREIGRLLKTHHQTTFKNYLNSIRMAEAKRLLKESNFPISEIAYLAGYNNVTHFNRVFKASEFVSPGAYRELIG